MGYGNIKWKQIGTCNCCFVKDAKYYFKAVGVFWRKERFVCQDCLKKLLDGTNRELYNDLNAQ